MSHEYPKALYKGGMLLVGVDPDTVTVNSAEEEAKASESGYLPFDRDKCNAAEAVTAPPKSSDEVDDQGEEQSEATEGEAPKKRIRPRKTAD